MRGKIERVIVVGAGPVGLLTALFLGQRGIAVDVVEASDKVNDSPRGLAYGSAAVSVLSRAGILNKVIERGYVPADVSWRRPNGEFIVGFQVPKISLSGLPSIVMLPVGSLSPLLVEEIQKLDNVTLNWNHRVLGTGQDENQAWVEVEVEEQGSKVTKRMTAHFVIGCDGGSSAVRKSIFGSNFPGWTWHKQLVVVNAYMNFDGLNLSDIQWVVDPENWYVIGQINKKGLWRLVYGETLGLSVQEIKDRLPERLRRTLPGNPEPGQYQIANVTPYVCHQRCVEKMRVGRILLAGDAAHLNNPMGGLGLTTGICDVGSLVDCLFGIGGGHASLDILDKYDQERRRIFNEVVDGLSTANFRRIMQDPDQFIEKDPSYKLMMASGGNATMSAAQQQVDQSLGCDLTRFYDKPIAFGQE
ncbi:hypothetical protein BKA61DRAFT_696546 [Leptodontidium sp. MPI-SDFR-AT-0119]|nr:hypothetical protein BKA61DRAFT_696546 [Leptodontidium sp. MPI-SDFR-AT-0119]